MSDELHADGIEWRSLVTRDRLASKDFRQVGAQLLFLVAPHNRRLQPRDRRKASGVDGPNRGSVCSREIDYRRRRRRIVRSNAGHVRPHGRSGSDAGSPFGVCAGSRVDHHLLALLYVSGLGERAGMGTLWKNLEEPTQVRFRGM